MIELAALDTDMEKFKNGVDTTIGERGLTLSGGQRQRVAIARACILDPDILVLDDSFSAVDTATEGRILAGLVVLRRRRTTVFVSHRVSTLRRAGLVLVLEDGRVTELGSPAALLAQGGFYARTAALQKLAENT